jgi:histidinol-phosphate/aromatic aminotransferase/cobyric acid decarboxylase-like protein
MKEVSIANGVTAICSMLAFMLGDVGDGVLLMRPIYGKFENDFTIVAQYISFPTLFVKLMRLDAKRYMPTWVIRIHFQRLL